MENLFLGIKNSFKKAMNGEESIQAIIWKWGVIPYIAAFFLFDYAILKINFYSIDVLISVLVATYFAWHLYVLRKCAPKKPKLSDEEKKRLNEEKKHNRGKKIIRKLTLQEPLTEWDPVFVTTMLDIFFITYFLSYLN